MSSHRGRQGTELRPLLKKRAGEDFPITSSLNALESDSEISDGRFAQPVQLAQQRYLSGLRQAAGSFHLYPDAGGSAIH
jgi:hypothetical protein